MPDSPIVIARNVIVEDGTPPVEGPYNESRALLAYTVYGSYILCTFRVNLYGIGFFYVGNSTPFSIKEVLWWSDDLPYDGGIK